MTVTWRIDLRIHDARPERVDAILAALGDEWEGLDLNAAEYPADRPTTLITWGVDQLVCSASFEAFAADLARVVREANAAYAQVAADGTCLDFPGRATWRSEAHPRAAEADVSAPAAPVRAADRPADADDGRAGAAHAAIVICRSMGDGDATAYGPFAGETFGAAVAAAKRWLRTQPCKPRRRDPFWQPGGPLECERRMRGDDGPGGHEIVWCEQVG